ncbi:MAG TPA: universal stress protein [Bryobacteraceae bacterium]|nr:universal stress protein [Bryobacteraceae bacterium]
MPAARPSPEELLRRIEAEERQSRRGRLKIFLGYASRVGKSFRMLDEGRRRKQRGQDVVIGYIQGKLEPEVSKLLETIEVIPGLKVRMDGKEDEVMDVVAILRRNPQVCLVDELAHDNPPGSRNPRRWQDVKELLDNGITVVTAINLQYIAEQQEAVEKITGKRPGQTVPEAFIRSADEIVIVDAPPGDLQEREGASAADTRRLSELRELALLLAAEVVDQQLHLALDLRGVETFLGSQERILVCITPRSNAKRMLETGHRNAQRFHCDLLALYVRQKGLSASDEELVEQHLALARELGAKVHILEASGSASGILEFARAHGITQLFVGHSLRSRWRELLLGNPLDQLIEAADAMDVRIFPHSQARTVS